MNANTNNFIRDNAAVVARPHVNLDVDIHSHWYMGELTPLGGQPSASPQQLVAHIAVLQQRLGVTCVSQPILTIPKRQPLTPTLCADPEQYAFDVQLLATLSPSRLRGLYLQSNDPDRQVVVLTGTPTDAQLRSGFLCVAQPPNPETAWQEAQWYLDRDPEWEVAADEGDADGSDESESVVNVFADAIGTAIMDHWRPDPCGHLLSDLVCRTGMVLGAQVDYWLDGRGKPVEVAIAEVLKENGYSSRARTGLWRQHWNRDTDWETPH